MPTDLRIKLPLANYKVEQIVEKRKHLYRATLSDGTTRNGGGVTGVLGIISKPALIPWATKTALSCAEAALTARIGGKITLTASWIKEIMEEAKKKPDKVKDDAADLGTRAHAFFDAFIRGEKVDSVPEILVPAVTAFHNWIRESKIRVIQGDTKVFSLIHRYGGALDAIGMGDEGEFVLLDWKTSSGCYPEMALQVAAYSQAFKETYGIEVSRAIIVRFSKVPPVEFETKEVVDIKKSFNAFISAKELQSSLQEDQFC